MMPAPDRVLLYGFWEEAPLLASRIRTIGYETVAASEPRAAAGLMNGEQPRVAAALLPADFALPERSGELDHLLRAAGPFGLRFLATGGRPDEAARAQLKARGVDLCLWSPFQEQELRFVLNRAVFDSAPGHCEPGRSDARTLMRVPTELSALVHTGGRVKPAQIYCLSAAGCFLETRRPCPVGASLEVAFALAEIELCLAARVVVTNVPGNLQRSKLPCGMGVEFRELAPEAHEALHAYVEARAGSYEL